MVELQWFDHWTMSVIVAFQVTRTCTNENNQTRIFDGNCIQRMQNENTLKVFSSNVSKETGRTLRAVYKKLVLGSQLILSEGPTVE